MRTEIKESKMENFYLSNLITCPNINTVEPLGTDTSPTDSLQCPDKILIYFL